MLTLYGINVCYNFYIISIIFAEGILTTEEVITVTLKVISTTTKVISTTEEVAVISSSLAKITFVALDNTYWPQ